MPDATTILAAVLIAVVPSLVYLAILNAIDRYEKEPWTILLACLGVGALVAPAITIGILALLGRPATLPPAFAPGPATGAITPVIETLVLGVLMIVLTYTVRDEFDDTLDGVIYGAAMGAGFGAAESFLYVLGGTALLTPSTVAMLVIAGLNQAFYMAVFGAILGWAQGLPARQRWVAIVLGLGTAAWLHAFHDTLPQILSRVLGDAGRDAGPVLRLMADLLNWLGIITLGVVVVLAWRREALILRAELRDEVASGLVSDADYATITSAGGRVGREWRLLREHGLAGTNRLRRRYALEGELAFHKWRMKVRNRRTPPAERGDALRAEIRRLSDTLPEATA